MKNHRRIVAVLIAAGLAGHSVAENDDSDQRKPRKHHSPPPAAVEACAALLEGDSCSFIGRRDEEVEGICFLPDEAVLACRPNSPLPRLRREEVEADSA